MENLGWPQSFWHLTFRTARIHIAIVITSVLPNVVPILISWIIWKAVMLILNLLHLISVDWWDGEVCLSAAPSPILWLYDCINNAFVLQKKYRISLFHQFLANLKIKIDIPWWWWWWWTTVNPHLPTLKGFLELRFHRIRAQKLTLTGSTNIIVTVNCKLLL